MVIDTSALVAILEDEPEASQFSEAIAQARLRLLSAVSLVETSIVIENRRGAAGKHALDVLLEKAAIEVNIHRQSRWLYDCGPLKGG